MYTHKPQVSVGEHVELVKTILSLNDYLENDAASLPKPLPLWSNGRAKLAKTGAWGEDSVYIYVFRSSASLALNQRAEILQALYEFTRDVTKSDLDLRVVRKLVPHMSIVSATQWIGPVGLTKEKELAIFNGKWRVIKEDGELVDIDDDELLIRSDEIL